MPFHPWDIVYVGLIVAVLLAVWLGAMKPQTEAKKQLEKEQSQRMQPLK